MRMYCYTTGWTPSDSSNNCSSHTREDQGGAVSRGGSAGGLSREGPGVGAMSSAYAKLLKLFSIGTGLPLFLRPLPPAPPAPKTGPGLGRMLLPRPYLGTFWHSKLGCSHRPHGGHGGQSEGSGQDTGQAGQTGGTICVFKIISDGTDPLRVLRPGPSPFLYPSL